MRENAGEKEAAHERTQHETEDMKENNSGNKTNQ